MLLLWDIQYGVLLASQRSPVPASLHRSKERPVRVELAFTGDTEAPNQVLLALQPALHTATNVAGESHGVSTVLVVPLSVPRTSTIANAMGRAAAGKDWLQPINQQKRGGGEGDDDQTQLIKGVHLTMDPTGLTPYQARTLRLMLESQERGRPEEVEHRWSRYLELAAEAKTGEKGREPPLGHLFSKLLLDVVLLVPLAGKGQAGNEGQGGEATSKGVAATYARGVVSGLLERKAVSDSMVDGGLLPALLARNDWVSLRHPGCCCYISLTRLPQANIVLAMSAVIDLPESAIMSALAAVVSRHRQNALLTGPDAMEVDTPGPASPPALPGFLALVVAYPASPGLLRVALRKHLPSAEDVVSILVVLDGWVERWAANEPRLAPEKVKKDAHGVPVPVFAQEKRTDMPPLDKVCSSLVGSLSVLTISGYRVPQTLTFIQAILDASLLALLSYTPSHALLRTLSERLQPELVLVSELQALQGPLQPFASAHARAVHEGAHGPPQTDLKIDWRARKKAEHEKNEMNLGVYQIEELVI